MTGLPTELGALTPAVRAPQGKPPGRIRRWAKQYRREDVIMGYLFLLVPMAIFLVFFLVAMIFDLGISFTNWHIVDTPKWVGLDNYKAVFDTNPYNPFWPAVVNSLEFAAIVVPVQTTLAFGLAVIVNQNIYGKKFFRTVFYFPSVTSSVAITLLFLWLFSDQGLVNYFIGKLGAGPVGFISDPNLVLKSIMGLNIWTTSGTYMIIFLAALQDVPRELYEAAAIDGANAWRTITRVTIPLIRPAFFLIVATGLIGTIQVFDQVFVASTGTGGPGTSTLTLVLYIYITALSDVQYGQAAAISFVMFIIILSATLLVRRFIQEEGAF
ncbi:MAG TPA: sugar ABC transporter permease [Chloroflexota bacterium]|nr:sugar ABC transporter permease [Chloroflexota bacterium]